MSFRTEAINAVKSMGITPGELGITPKIIEVVPNDFLDAIKTLMFECDIEPDKARQYIPEEYWEELGLNNRYKVVEVELTKTVVKKVYVAIPNDVDNDEAESIVEDEDFDMDDLYDEGCWEISNTCLCEHDLEADDVRGSYSQYELVNYDTFEKE